MRNVPLILAAGVLFDLSLLNPEPARAELAVSDHKDSGVVCVLDDVSRRNEVLTVKFRLRTRTVGKAGGTQTCNFTKTSGSYALDEEKGVKYFPLTDEAGRPIAQAPGYVDEDAYGSAGWMKLPAPPAEVKSITVAIDECQPFEGVAIVDR